MEGREEGEQRGMVGGEGRRERRGATVQLLNMRVERKKTEGEKRGEIFVSFPSKGLQRMNQFCQ